MFVGVFIHKTTLASQESVGDALKNQVLFLLYNLHVLILLLTYIEMLLFDMIVSKQFDIGELSNVCWDNFAKLLAKCLSCKVL